MVLKFLQNLSKTRKFAYSPKIQILTKICQIPEYLQIILPLKHRPPFSPTTITSRNNAPISNYGGGFRCKSEYPWCIIEIKYLFNFLQI
ncbi:Uncharacterized protein FWK35_00020795 [Aphis craccivora]|uniref:Uncharacterized protein n=1 Tax=Aphis craccivora TaxID=307492 RepID=A0A6G0YM07_APHCR|nr:Uncharacterized protein FWK35_00020795 [Aphis craccivora]